MCAKGNIVLHCTVSTVLTCHKQSFHFVVILKRTGYKKIHYAMGHKKKWIVTCLEIIIRFLILWHSELLNSIIWSARFIPQSIGVVSNASRTLSNSVWYLTDCTQLSAGFIIFKSFRFSFVSPHLLNVGSIGCLGAGPVVCQPSNYRSLQAMWKCTQIYVQ